jgi:succinoglycan biosynthesis protein ExoM
MKRLKITICLCTYRRHHLLGKLLSELIKQKNDALYSFNIIVVDNDKIMSAENVINATKTVSDIEIRYFHEPFRNISLARNKAVKNADGDLLAFIDDDEVPSPNWLATLARCYINNSCDGVLGPVIPRFIVPPPSWILKSGLFDRSNPPTGTVISTNDLRTGNALLKRELFIEDINPFNPNLGRTGGEDVEFFTRMVKKGYKFIWCREAAVFELIPKERMTIGYHLMRGINRGRARSIIDPFLSLPTLRSLLAILVYFFLLPFCLIGGFALFNSYLIKLCDHSGRLFGHFLRFLGLDIEK